MCRKIIRKCPQNKLWWKLSCEARPAASSDPVECCELTWPIQTDLWWAELARSLYSQWMWDIGKGDFWSWGTLWSWELKAVCWRHSYQLGQQSFLEGGFEWNTWLPLTAPRQCFSLWSKTPKQQIPGPQLLPTESESLGVRPETTHFNKVHRRYWFIVEIEKSYTNEGEKNLLSNQVGTGKRKFLISVINPTIFSVIYKVNFCLK